MGIALKRQEEEAKNCKQIFIHQTVRYTVEILELLEEEDGEQAAARVSRGNKVCDHFNVFATKECNVSLLTTLPEGCLPHREASLRDRDCTCRVLGAKLAVRALEQKPTTNATTTTQSVT